VNDPNYTPHFPLTAKRDKLTLYLNRPRLSLKDIEKIESAQRENRVSE